MFRHMLVFIGHSVYALPNSLFVLSCSVFRELQFMANRVIWFVYLFYFFSGSGGACSTYGGGERCIQCFGGET
jgi:hypothetical protein